MVYLASVLFNNELLVFFITVVQLTCLILIDMFKCVYCSLLKLSPSYDNKYMFAFQKVV